MKAEMKVKKKFQPIEITLVIETEEELLDLYSRTDVSPAVVNAVSPEYQATNDSCLVLWDLLNDARYNNLEFE
jgi:hypothetical protein